MIARVSIVIPTYHREEELNAYLFPSLAGQTRLPSEIIVVDDTEGDSVRAICGEWERRFTQRGVPLRFMKNPPPRSAARARNEGAAASSGEILLFLDSDLELSPGYVEGVLAVLEGRGDAVGAQGLITNWGEEPLARRFMERNGRPGSLSYGLAGSLARNLLGATVPSKNSCRLFEYPVILDQPVECEWLSGSNLSLKRAAFEATRFETDMEGYSLGEDILLSRRLRVLGRLFITPGATCIHRWSQSGSPQRTSLGEKERLFFHRLFGLRGDLIYFNRRLAFKALGYSPTT